MANYRNEFEFRSGLLNALGVEHTEADAKNEERWRAKMLDGLEVEYNQNDVNQFDLFRAKLVEGVEAKAEGGGGGGGSSDFSTATVTINKGAMGTQVDGIIPWFSEEDNQTYSTVEFVDEETLTVKVPVGGNSITVYFSRSAQSTNGDIESGGDVSFMSKILKAYVITGDCSISFT